MRKSNKWTHGATRLVAPLLPDYLRGRSACLLQDATFDSRVGSEVYLAILEDTEFADVLGRTRPFELFCRPVLARTSHGLILHMLFTVRSQGEEVVRYELFLNPHQMDSIRMLSAWGQQTHFKALVLDYANNEVRDWFEFENNYGMDKVVAAIAQCIGHEREGDFQLAQQEFIRDNPLEETQS